MATTLRALYAALEEKMPRALSCAWDNDGIMCSSDLDKPVHKILCALDVTDRIIEEAEEEGCDCIVSHHPLVFHKLPGIDPDAVSGRRIVSLLSKNIAVLSFHTRLDAAEGGVNDVICESLNIRVTGPFTDTDGDPIGRMAEEETPVNFASFCQQVKTALGSPVLHCVSAKKPVKKIAVLGGDGKDDWSAALAAGADTYLTGTMSYNGFLDAKASGLNVIAAGHYYTEAPVAKRLAAWIGERFPDVEVLVSETPCEVLTV